MSEIPRMLVKHTLAHGLRLPTGRTLFVRHVGDDRYDVMDWRYGQAHPSVLSSAVHRSGLRHSLVHYWRAAEREMVT